MLHTLRDRFRARGMKMLFLMPADRYELYQHFATGNPYPRKGLGARLEKLDSLDFFINTLPRLRKRLDAGEQDLYLGNDTHWSQKGACVAADLLYEKITLLESGEAEVSSENRPRTDDAAHGPLKTCDSGLPFIRQ